MSTNAGLPGNGIADLPLSGLRVIDMAPGPLAPIGQHLVELGAEVIRVEPPGGCADRTAGEVFSRIGIGFAATNLGKRAIALDLSTAAGRLELDRLAQGADILLESARPGSDLARRIDVPGLLRRHPALVVLSATAFGQHGPQRDWHATGPIFDALSGVLSRSGLPGRAPLLLPGNLAYACATAHAAYVVLLAHWNRLRTGRGDWLDLSLLEAATQALDPGFGMAGSAAGDPPWKWPRGRIEAGFMYPIYRCADGHVRICILTSRQWQRMFEWLGRPAAFADPAFNKLDTRFRSAALADAISALVADKTRAVLDEEGQHWGVPVAGVRRMDEVVATPHFRARGAFASVEIAPGVKADFPNGVFEVDGRRAGPRAGLPALEADPGWTQPRPAPATPVDAGARPLSGLRVLDLGVIVVGGETGRLLADQGADVVKVENPDFLDGSRQTRDGSVMSLSFASGHRNKRALSINLRDPAGKALFLDLAAKADVILSNFKPGTLAGLGFDARTLLEVNPRLILLDSSAFGQTGPWSGRLGYGPVVRASTGLTAEWCYADDPGSFADAITVYPDHVSARLGALGVLALLIRRLRSGRGGTVSISQAEVMLHHMGARIAAQSLQAQGIAAEAAPPHDAPWGVFACAGDDDWCVVTVRGDDDWQALATAIDRPDLAADPALGTARGRAGARDRVDAALGQWLASMPAADAMARLQAAGIPAAQMLRVAEVIDFPHYRARASFRPASHPAVTTDFYLEAAPVGSFGLPLPDERIAPLLGEHSRQVLREWLGIRDADIDRLVRSRIAGMTDT